MKNNKFRGVTCPDFKTYFDTVVIKLGWLKLAI